MLARSILTSRLSSRYRRKSRYSISAVGSSKHAPSSTPRSAEKLVTALAAQRHVDVRARKSRHQERGEHGWVSQRLIQMVPQDLKRLAQARLVGLENVVMGLELARHTVCISLFAERLLREFDGKRVDVPGRELAHDGDQQRGIDAAAQKDTQRHIAHQTRNRGFSKALAQFLDQMSLLAPGNARRLRGSEVLLQPPKRFDLNPAAFDDHTMSGGELPDFRVCGPRCRDVAIQEILSESLEVGRAADARVLEQGLD